MVGRLLQQLFGQQPHRAARGFRRCRDRGVLPRQRHDRDPLAGHLPPPAEVHAQGVNVCLKNGRDDKYDKQLWQCP